MWTRWSKPDQWPTRVSAIFAPRRDTSPPVDDNEESIAKRMELFRQRSFWRAVWDTWGQLHSPFFWVVEVVITIGASVFAVSLYPLGSTALEDAQTQGWVVGGVLGILLLGVFLANFIAVSPRRQRNEARTLASQFHRESMSDDEIASLIRELIALQIDAGGFASDIRNAAAAFDMNDFRRWLILIRESLREAGRRYESAIIVVSTRLATKEYEIPEALNEASETIRSAIEGLEQDMTDPRAASPQ